MEGDETNRAKRGKMTVLAVLALILALGGGGGAYYWTHHARSVVKPAAVVISPFNLAIPTIMATLDSEGGHATFVRVASQIQLADQRDAAAARAHIPQIEDLYQTYLHDTRPEELAGSGLYRLREALLAQISNALAPIQVRDLFFTEVLVQ